MNRELRYVTSNEGKFSEVSEYIRKNEPLFQIRQFSVELDEIQSLDQKLVVEDKVKKAFTLINAPVLVDDGGIFIEGYHEFPGTLSKYVFQGLGFKGISRLFEENQSAAFKLQLAYYDGRKLEFFEGSCHGTLIKPAHYHSHPKLPFTAIFKPLGSDKTLAELRTSHDYSRYSFRQQALKKFLIWYKKEFNVA